MNDFKALWGDAISDADLKKVIEYIKSIRFGTITLILQDGKVVQIEKTEKFKLK